MLYLTGLESSNAAVVVQPGGDAKLFTDFRYIEDARNLGTRRGGADETRDPQRHHASKLPSRVQFEADALPYAQWQVLADGEAELVPARGVVEELRAVKDEQELAKIRRAARVADRGLEALTAETWVGRSEREIAWRLRELLHAHGADELVVRPDRRVGLERREAARASERAHRRARDARDRRLGRATRRLLQRLHAHVLDRPAARSSARDLRAVPRGAAARLLEHQGRADRRRGRRARARSDHRRRASARSSATGSATASA